MLRNRFVQVQTLQQDLPRLWALEPERIQPDRTLQVAVMDQLAEVRVPERVAAAHLALLAAQLSKAQAEQGAAKRRLDTSCVCNSRSELADHPLQ
jgi:hypothetical protein